MTALDISALLLGISLYLFLVAVVLQFGKDHDDEEKK